MVKRLLRCLAKFRKRCWGSKWPWFKGMCLGFCCFREELQCCMLLWLLCIREGRKTSEQRRTRRREICTLMESWLNQSLNYLMSMLRRIAAMIQMARSTIAINLINMESMKPEESMFFPLGKWTKVSRPNAFSHLNSPMRVHSYERLLMGKSLPREQFKSHKPNFHEDRMLCWGNKVKQFLSPISTRTILTPRTSRKLWAKSPEFMNDKLSNGKTSYLIV